MRRTHLTLLSLLAACGTASEEQPDAGVPLAAPGVDATLAAAAALDPADLSPAEYRPGRLVVGFTRDAPAPELAVPGGLAKRLGSAPVLPVATYALPDGVAVVDAADALRGQPGIAFVEADLVRTVASTDPHRRFQWHFDAIDLDTAHDAGADGTGAVVAVIDTGVSSGGGDTPEHLLAGWDFVDDDADANDLHGHGTHVAGTVAQATGNGFRGAGVAPGAQILPVRVLDADGSGYSSDVVAGILWAVENGAQVLNLSLGSSGSSAAELLAVEWAVEQGALVVASSGNDAAGSVSFPAGYDAALAVGATDAAHARAPYSNRGQALDIAAPGGDLSADLNGDGYGDGVLQETFGSADWGAYFFQGTSMAAPHVAGAAALLVGAGATPEEAGALLLETADDIDEPGWDVSTGAGLLDAGEAVTRWMAREDTPEQGDPDEGEGQDRDDEEPADTGSWDTGEVDLTAPTVVRQWVRQRGARVHVVVVTDEPSLLRLCTSPAVCIDSDLAQRHAMLLETDSRRLRGSVRDVAGNERRLQPIRLR